MNLNRAFALRLSNLLSEKKMTKYKLEKETGLTHSALRYIFNEVNTDVKFSTIVKVCNALNITLIEFFNDDLFKLENLDFEQKIKKFTYRLSELFFKVMFYTLFQSNLQ